MQKEKGQVADELEVLEALTKILRREESEDVVLKFKEESKSRDSSNATSTEKSERAEVVRVRPKLSDVIRAAELIGKSYGMFSERVEGSIALPLIICGEDDLE